MPATAERQAALKRYAGHSAGWQRCPMSWLSIPITVASLAVSLGACCLGRPPPAAGPSSRRSADTTAATAEARAEGRSVSPKERSVEVAIAAETQQAAMAGWPDFRTYVHRLVRYQRRVPYSALGPDTWDAISEADAATSTDGRVRTLYCDQWLPVASRVNQWWEREHLWPRSLGDFADEPCDFVFTDLHNLFATEPGINAARGNLPFGYCTMPDCVPKRCAPDGPENRMRGGVDGVWEVWPGRRGDVARTLLYMDVRYEGGLNELTGCPEPDLVLTDDRSLIVSTSRRTAYMGLLSDLVAWHWEDPVDDAERRRNDVIERHQGNRNPFVDHPDWVRRVFPPTLGPGTPRAASPGGAAEDRVPPDAWGAPADGLPSGSRDAATDSMAVEAGLARPVPLLGTAFPEPMAAASGSPNRGHQTCEGYRPCQEFATQDEAQAYFEACGRPNRMDGDGDGRACENLP